MKMFLEYIVLNYTWFLGGAIIILLAIIGSYADKTNFGEGKTKEEKDEKLMELQLEKNELQQQLEQKTQKENDGIGLIEILEEEPIINKTEEDKNQQNAEKVQISEVIDLSTLELSEERYAKFDKVFDELLPKKSFDDGDLLDEIESISLDKTQKIDITEIPDLDDVDLPKIKSLDPIDQDIWKF